jgi:hypothetical protein
VGKTHLAISLAIAAAQQGRRVYYGTLGELITGLEEAQAAGKLLHRMKTLTHPALLVVDEIGYLPVSRTGAMLFFQLGCAVTPSCGAISTLPARSTRPPPRLPRSRKKKEGGDQPLNLSPRVRHFSRRKRDIPFLR